MFTRSSILVLCVGACCSLAAAQPGDRATPPTDAKGHPITPAGAGPLMFVSAHKAMGMSVKDNDDKTLGSIDDMIIDRGSGQVRYIVLKSGAVMGMGGKLVTVPYSSFGWHSADKDLALNATKDEIKSWPEFDKKAWADGARADDGYVRRIGKDYYDSHNSPWPMEAKADKTSTVKGTVNTITRRNMDNGREELVVVVTTPEGTQREVSYGPSWYAVGNNAVAIYRGTPVDVDVFSVNRNGHAYEMARSTRINGKEYPLYDKQGRAMWSPTNVSADADAWSAAPFVLASELKGKVVDARGQDCGKVKDTVLECSSGRIAFLVIDPDKAFLGIGDTNRLVPWTIMTRSLDGKVHIDADKTMITAAPAAPSDLHTLSGDYKTVYSSYQITAPTYEPMRK